jgi:hypothetical protein
MDFCEAYNFCLCCINNKYFLIYDSLLLNFHERTLSLAQLVFMAKRQLHGSTGGTVQ